MSKPKSKPVSRKKRVEYVTAASHEILMDERDALEGALTDMEQNRASWVSESLRLEQVICDIKNAHKLEIDNYNKAAEAKYLTMCEYRDQWAKQSAIWEEEAKRLCGDLLDLQDQLMRAKRNVFSKLWHWFTDPPRDNQ